MQNLNTNEILPYQTQFLKVYEAKGKSANSLKCYRLDFECFNDFISEYKNLDFNDTVVREFEDFLEKKYASINSRRRKLQTLRLFFDFLVEKKAYPENPIKKIASAPKSLLPPSPTTYPEIFMAQEALKKQKEATTNDLQKLVILRNAVMFTLIYEAGLSVAPLAKLKKDNLYIGENEIRVIVTPKKRDPYSIPVPLEYKNLFEDYLELYEKVLNETGKDIDDLFFFANAYKIIRGSLSPRGIEDIFHKFSKDLTEQITPKSLRQSCIVKWLVEKQPEVTIKEWLGLAPSYSMALYKKYIEDQRNAEKPEDQLDYKGINFSW